MTRIDMIHTGAEKPFEQEQLFFSEYLFEAGKHFTPNQLSNDVETERSQYFLFFFLWGNTIIWPNERSVSTRKSNQQYIQATTDFFF